MHTIETKHGVWNINGGFDGTAFYRARLGSGGFGNEVEVDMQDIKELLGHWIISERISRAESMAPLDAIEEVLTKAI